MINKQPGIFVRLGNLIIIQVLFIFGALGLILFSPNPGPDLTDKQAEFERRLAVIGELIGETDENQTFTSDYLRPLLGDESTVEYAALVSFDSTNSSRVLATYQLPMQSTKAVDDGDRFNDVCDPSLLRHTASQAPGHVHRTGIGSRSTVYYLRVDRNLASPMVLVTAVNHGLLVSPISTVLNAVLLLFLASTLISLLLVYLLSKRFSQPLDRLIRGLEKTTQGELYYMIEAEGDLEFRRLVTAFNRMTQTLWDNQRELKSYNIRLKRSNVSILETQLFLATLIDSTPLAVVVTNDGGQVMLFNRAASSMFGYDADEVVGNSTTMLFSEGPDDRSAQQHPEQPQHAETICRRRDGEHFPAYVVSRRLMASTDRYGANLIIIRDISESRNFQNMMVRLDRYYTRGEMAGDIAHEINNYLAVLMGNLELLPMLLAKGNTERIESKLDVMKTTVERIARFANGLMDAPHEGTRLEATSMNQMVENIIAFLKPQNKFDSIRLRARLSDKVTMVHIDPGQIQQLLVNLIYNAGEALRNNPAPKEIMVETSLVDGVVPMVQVEVRDNGPGVPEKHVPDLFGRRFTTKRKGHGIGLITCRKILENHGGSLQYRYDNGALFYFRLPVNPSDIASPSVGSPDVAETPVPVIAH